MRAGVRAGMLEDVANTKILSENGEREILGFVAKPKVVDGKLPVVILLHEFYGLTPEICGKADAIAKEVGCIVIAPDTYRGESTRFIPKAIYLALGTPQFRIVLMPTLMRFWLGLQHYQMPTPAGSPS